MLWLWLGCAVATGLIADYKGYGYFRGLAVGCLIGPLGVLVALFYLKKTEASKEKEAVGNGLKKCPSCAEFIKVEAVKCRYCSSDL